MSAVPISPAVPAVPNLIQALKLMIWLKWTLLWRTYSRQRARLIGILLMAILFAPLSIIAAVVCYLFGRDTPLLVPVLTRSILGVLYLIWVVTPLLGFPLNESYDPSRLFIYPVRLRTILLASVVGGIFEPTTLLALPVFVVIVLLFSVSLLPGLVAALAVLLFLVHSIAIAQLIMLSLIGFLRSRRFRDITIVLFPLIAMVYFVAQQAFARGLVQFDVPTLIHRRFWGVFDWLPPGWATQAATQSADGHFGMALLYLALLLAVALAPIWLAAGVLKGLYTGDRGPLAPAHVPSRVRVAILPAAATAARGGVEIAALVRKERTYLVREPQYKALAVNALYMFVVVFFVFSTQLNHPHRYANPYAPPLDPARLRIEQRFEYIIFLIRLFALPTLLMLSSRTLTFNIFGGDGAAITALLSFPTPRRKIIVAKNLAYAPVVAGVCILGAAGTSALQHTWSLFPLVCAWILLAVPVMIGAGNLLSVRLPQKMIVRGQRWGRGGQVSFGGGSQGCGYALLQTACYFGSLALLAPVAAAVIVPEMLDERMLLAATLPLSAVYSALIYWGATNWAAGIMQRREPEIVAVLAADE